MNVGRAALVTGLAAAVVAGVGMGKEMVVSRVMGASPAMDAYLLALAVVVFGASILAGALQTSLIPVLCGVDGNSSSQDAAASQRLFTGVIVFALLVGGVCWLLSTWLLPVALRGMVEGADADSLRAAAFWLSPLWCTGLLAGLGHGALQSSRQFLGSGLAPAAVPVGVALALAAGGFGDDVAVLAAGTLLGGALEVAVLGWLLWRRGWRLRRPEAGELFASPGMRRVWAQTWALAPGMAAMASAQLVDRAMASMAGPGAVSVLHYGSKIPAMLASMGGMAVATALLPAFSMHLGKKDEAAALGVLRRWSRGLLWCSAGVAAAGMFVSTPVARLCYEGGAFTPLDTLQTAQVQACALLHIPFYWSSLAMARHLAAAGRNGWLSLISLGNIVVNVLGNLALMPWLGASGIALATAFMYCFSLVACKIAVRRASP